jgi:hypothetical protein
MTKEQLKQELLIAYAERQEKETMLNFVADDFVDVVTYELKAVDCKIQALLNRINQVKMDELLNDIKKIPPVSKQNGI